MPTVVRLAIDAARCDGHGICALRCPELVSLDQWGFARVEGKTVTGRGAVRRARRAVASCPARALSVLEDPIASGNATAAPVGQTRDRSRSGT